MRRACCLVVTAVCLSGCSDRGEPATPAPPPAGTDQATPTVWSFSPGIGRRAGVPAEETIALDEGLQAIAIQVAPGDGGRRECFFHLYLDSDVDVAWPPGDSGSRSDVEPGRGRLSFIRKLGDEDAARITDRLFQFSGRVLLRSPVVDWERRVGFYETTLISEYRRELLPGLALLSFDFLCGPPAAEREVEIWLLRDDAEKHTLDAESPDETKLRRFSVPPDLLERARPHLQDAAAHNARLPLESK